MPKGNLIRVSFGKPASKIPQSRLCRPVPPPTDLAVYRNDRGAGFLDKIKVNMVTRARHTLVINFTIQEDSWMWFVEHEHVVRQYMNRVRLIHLVDANNQNNIEPFITDEDGEVVLVYPEGQARCLRVYFFLSSQHNPSKEEVLTNREVTLFVQK